MGNNILAFETATNACSVALQVGDYVFSHHEIAPQQHAKLLLPMIQALLSEAKIKLSDLDVIAFGSGPGSFMGVRLAAATAQGLAFGLSIPLIPISTLRILAQTTPTVCPGGFVLAGWDAKMHEIYWGFYRLDENNIMQSVIADQLCTPAQFDTHAIDRKSVV